jgi:hypothetical protein
MMWLYTGCEVLVEEPHGRPLSSLAYTICACPSGKFALLLNVAAPAKTRAVAPGNSTTSRSR